MKKICKVHKNSDLNLFYVLSDRIDEMKEGEYVLDPLKNIYVMYAGYLLPVDKGDCPEIGYQRIEVSNDKRIHVPRATDLFNHTALKYDLLLVKLGYRKNNTKLIKNKKGRVMIKAVW